MIYSHQSRSQSFSRDIQSLQRILSKMEEIIKMIKTNIIDYLGSGKGNTPQCGSQIISIFKLNEKFLIAKPISDLLAFIDSKDIATSFLEKFLHNYLYILNLIAADPELLKEYKIYGEQNYKFEFLCMDPSIPFKQFLESEQSVNIVTSGTLKPFDLFESRLDTQFDMKLSVSPDLEVWKEKLFVFKQSNIFEFSSMKKIRFTYSTRGDKRLREGCLKYIGSLGKLTTEGVLVFLPSYNVLEMYSNDLGRSGMLRDFVNASKKIFFEKKGENYEHVFSRFSVR